MHACGAVCMRYAWSPTCASTCQTTNVHPCSYLVHVEARRTVGIGHCDAFGNGRIHGTKRPHAGGIRVTSAAVFINLWARPVERVRPTSMHVYQNACTSGGESRDAQCIATAAARSRLPCCIGLVMALTATCEHRATHGSASYQRLPPDMFVTLASCSD